MKSKAIPEPASPIAAPTPVSSLTPITPAPPGRSPQGRGEKVVDELVTLRDWLRFAVSGFNAAGLVYGHGTSNALDEAAFLILETLHLPLDQLDPWLDAKLTSIEREEIRDIIAARIDTRKPASYLTGTAYIQGHRFRVDERVIVPRSYIGELLATGRLDELIDPGREDCRRLLEMCTGSGCLAILAALRFDGALIDAVELSEGALEVARRNVADYGLAERVRLLEGDLFGPVGGERYDLIIANPPYVAAAEVASFGPEYAAEPKMAHLGGEDGLDLARRIVDEAGEHLTPGGTLVMEIGTGRHLLEAAYPQLDFIWLDTEGSEGEVAMIGAEALGARPGRKRKGQSKG